MRTTSTVTVLYISMFVVAAIAGLLLFNPFPLFFLNDDFIHIPLSKAGVLFQRKSFRPLCDLSVGLDYFLWKKQAWGYHLTNLLLHLADSILVFVFTRNFLKNKVSEHFILISLFTSLLFFIYPFHSETVYWILGRSASLGVLFFLPAIIFYLKRNEKKIYFSLSLVFFSAGLLTYESVWVFPLVAMCVSRIDIKSAGANTRKEIRYIITITMLFLAFLLLRYVTIGEVSGNYEASAFRSANIKSLLLNAARLSVRSIAPPALSVKTFFIGGFAALTLVCAIFFSIKKNKKALLHISFLAVCFALSIIPYLSLGIDTHGSEGERFLYLPSIFICLLIIYFIFEKFEKSWSQIILLIMVLGYSTFYLFKVQKNYAAASAITQATIAEVQKMQGKTRLFIDSLPQECNGATIFRLGFYEAVQWMKPLPTVLNVAVISIKENMSKSNIKYATHCIDYSLLQKNNPAFPGFNISTDAAFIYTDTALIIIK